jgi:hypothetical protein
MVYGTRGYLRQLRCSDVPLYDSVVDSHAHGLTFPSRVVTLMNEALFLITCIKMTLGSGFKYRAPGAVSSRSISVCVTPYV